MEGDNHIAICDPPFRVVVVEGDTFETFTASISRRVRVVNAQVYFRRRMQVQRPAHQKALPPPHRTHQPRAIGKAEGSRLPVGEITNRKDRSTFHQLTCQSRNRFASFPKDQRIHQIDQVLELRLGEFQSSPDQIVDENRRVYYDEGCHFGASSGVRSALTNYIITAGAPISKFLPITFGKICQTTVHLVNQCHERIEDQFQVGGKRPLLQISQVNCQFVG